MRSLPKRESPVVPGKSEQMQKCGLHLHIRGSGVAGVEPRLRTDHRSEMLDGGEGVVEVVEKGAPFLVLG